MNCPAAADPLIALRANADLYGWGGQFEYATAFDEPKLNFVLALWRDLARGGIPSRAELNMRMLKDVIAHFWMFEELRDGETRRYRCRRMGTAIAAAFGDMTGKYMDEAIPAPLIDRWTVACEAFLRCRRPVRFTCTVDLPQANYLRTEALHAPLLGAAGKPTILMAVSYFKPVANAAGPA